MSDSGSQQYRGSRLTKKRNAFSSPTVAAKQRGFARSTTPSRGSDASVHSRRSVSMIQSAEDAEIFGQVVGTTGVSVSKRSKVKRTAAVASPQASLADASESLMHGEYDPELIKSACSGTVDVMVGTALNLMRSFSPISHDGGELVVGGCSFGNFASNEEEEEEEDPLPPRTNTAPRGNLDLRHNDNSFHVLASLLVEFFQAKVVGKTLLLMPEDKQTVERLLPKSAVWDFIDAVQYRLEVTPVVAVTPIQFLTLQCQELCLDLEEANENPILAAFRLKQNPITMEVMTVLPETYFTSASRFIVGDDDDDKPIASNYNVDYLLNMGQSPNNIGSDEDNNSDGFVVNLKAPSGSSSDESAIKVASSRDIADEMLAAAEQEDKDNYLFHRIGTGEYGTVLDMNDDDSMPTDHDDELDTQTEEAFHAAATTAIENTNFPGAEGFVSDEDNVEKQQQQHEFELHPSVTGDYSKNSADEEGEEIEVQSTATEDSHGDNIEEQQSDDFHEEGEEIEVQSTATEDIYENNLEVKPLGGFNEEEEEELEIRPLSSKDISEYSEEEGHVIAVQPSATEYLPEDSDGEVEELEIMASVTELEVMPPATDLETMQSATEDVPEDTDKEGREIAAQPSATEDVPEVNDEGEKDIKIMPSATEVVSGDRWVEGREIPVQLPMTDDILEVSVEGKELEMMDVREDSGDYKQEIELQPSVTEDVPECSYDDEQEMEVNPSLVEDVPDDCAEGQKINLQQNLEVQQGGKDVPYDNDEDGGRILDVLSSKTEDILQEGDVVEKLEVQQMETGDVLKDHDEERLEIESESPANANHPGEDAVLSVQHFETDVVDEGNVEAGIEGTNAHDDRNHVVKTSDKEVELLDQSLVHLTSCEGEPMLESVDVPITEYDSEATEAARLDQKMDKAKAAAEELAKRMQDAAGIFFADLRSAVDAQVTNLHSAVDAQVANLQNNLNTQLSSNHENSNSFLNKVKSAGQTLCPPVELEAAEASAVDASCRAGTGPFVNAHENHPLQNEMVSNRHKSPLETVTAEALASDDSRQFATGTLFSGLVARVGPPFAGTSSNRTENILPSSNQEAIALREQVREQAPDQQLIIPSAPAAIELEPIKQRGSEVELLNIGNERNTRETLLPPFDVAKYDDMDVIDIVAKQQLLGELKEACSLAELSVTPETQRFWRDHVLTLQARLDALHVERLVTDTDLVNHGCELTGQDQCGTITERDDVALQLARSLSKESKQFRPMSQELTQSIQTEREQACYDVPMVDVVAPADLPGGYHFEAEIEGQRFLATVPPGGVQQGETFTCYMRELDSVAIDILVGYWKDGIFNMCDSDCCHPVAWNSVFCPLVMLGQIQTRINLDFLGRPKFGDISPSNRFVMLTVVVFWALTNIGLFAACNLKWSRGLELSGADACAFALINIAMYGFVVFVTQSTRSSLREKFMIREERCLDLEDICCAALCLPFTVSQMARHTANYDDYEAVCCSKTGLPDGVRVNQDPTKEAEGCKPDGYRPDGYKHDGYIV